MKKFLLLAALVLPMMALTSCTKGEGFFDGKWQANFYYSVDGEKQYDGVAELDIDKKSDQVIYTETYPKKPSYDEKNIGTYKMCGDYTLVVTYKDGGDTWTQTFQKDGKCLYYGGMIFHKK